MAYDFFQEQDDENQQQQGQVPGQAPNSNQPDGMVQLGPESATQDAQGRTSNSGSGGGTSSGSYTNLQSYLDANKSLNFGSDVAGKVQSKVDAAGQAQNEAETGFKSDVDKATVNSNPDLINQVGTDATQITSSPEKTSDFLRMRNAEYGGPNSLVDESDRYNNVTGATNTAQEEATATKSEGGRKALLDKNYGTGAGRYDYTPGQKNLDNLLIQNDPTSRDAFQKVQQGADAAGGKLTDLKSALQGYAGQGKATTQAARAGARGALGIDDAGNVLDSGNGAIQKELGSVDERLAARKAQLASNQQLLQPVAGKSWLKDLSPEQQQALGINPDDFGALDLYPDNTGYNRGSYAPNFQGFKVDPGYFFQTDPGSGSYLNFTSEPQLNRSTVSTPEDLAQLQALSQLSGVDQSWVSDPAQVGSQVDSPLYNFDKGKFGTDSTAKRNAFVGEMTALKNQWEGATQGSGAPGERTSGGIVDPTKLRAQANVIRAKYGLPPV